MKFLALLQGRKTYLVVIGGLLVLGLLFFEAIDAVTANYLFGLLGLGGVASFRSAIRKLAE